MSSIYPEVKLETTVVNFVRDTKAETNANLSPRDKKASEDNNSDDNKPKKYKKMHIPQTLRRAVWNYYIGESYGLGYCFAGCNGVISQTNFSCGHVLAEKHGGQLTVDNLRPVCMSCNSSMGTQNMIDFVKQYGLDKVTNTGRRIVGLQQESKCCEIM
jgi:hypothetical protein